LYFIKKAIDVWLKMEGKLTKKEMRHLDDAKREKHVREHVIQEV